MSGVFEEFVCIVRHVFMLRYIFVFVFIFSLFSQNIKNSFPHSNIFPHSLSFATLDSEPSFVMYSLTTERQENALKTFEPLSISCLFKDRLNEAALTCSCLPMLAKYFLKTFVSALEKLKIHKEDGIGL